MTSTHAQRKALGDYGERLASRHLQAAGLTVLDRNWRCNRGEIDIVAEDGSTLVICEVKTRRSDRFGTPLEAITSQKAARLSRLGWRWASEHQLRYAGLRVDVVAIMAPPRGRPAVEHLIGVV
ncbi:MAG: YraN family protein [Nocardioidaceae bacterium]